MLPPVLAISAGDDGSGRDLLEWLPALAEAGLQSILIREPLVTAARLRVLCEGAAAAGLEAWVHDRNPYARSRPEGLHLTANGVPPPHRRFGQSCHDEAELARAFARGATYALLSPVYRPTSKPGDRRPPLGPDGFALVAAGRPVFALGGIGPVEAAAVRRAGGVGVAVLGAIFGQPDPETAAGMMTKLLAAWSDAA